MFFKISILPKLQHTALLLSFFAQFIYVGLFMAFSEYYSILVTDFHPCYSVFGLFAAFYYILTFGYLLSI
jgi:hypothetical protein